MNNQYIFLLLGIIAAVSMTIGILISAWVYPRIKDRLPGPKKKGGA